MSRGKRKKKTWQGEVLGAVKKQEKKVYSSTISQEIIDEINRCAGKSETIDFDKIVIKED